MTANQTVTVTKCEFSDKRETAWNVFLNGQFIGRVCKFKDTACNTYPYSVRRAAGATCEMLANVWVRDHKSGHAARAEAVSQLVAAVAG